MQKGLHIAHFHVDKLHFDVSFQQFVVRAMAVGAHVIEQPLNHLLFPEEPGLSESQLADFQAYITEQMNAASSAGRRALWIMMRLAGPYALHTQNQHSLCQLWTNLVQTMPVLIVCSFNLAELERTEARAELMRHDGGMVGGEIFLHRADETCCQFSEIC